MNHNNCECKRCAEGADSVLKWQTEMLEKHGWYIHYIIETSNHHTHGLTDKFNHPDLQIALNIDPKIVNSIFHRVVELIKKGRAFSHNDVVEHIIKAPFKVKFVNAKEEQRDVLRIILPDSSGNLDFDSIEKPYDLQYA